MSQKNTPPKASPVLPQTKPRPVFHRWRSGVETFRHSLAYIDALPQLAILGFFIGSLTALIIVLFRWLVNQALGLMLDGQPEDFESLGHASIAIFIALGIVVIYLIQRWAGPDNSHVGVGHVLFRLHHFQGRLPTRNIIAQFAGAACAIISGQSVGREGPTVHLGAGAASWLGRRLKIPNNSLHILVGCGVTAAISACFNTPMAGVIFAMEVLLLQYSVVGFVPVILASVTGTVVTELIYPTNDLVLISDASMLSMVELPLVIGAGALIALVAGGFIKLHLFALSFHQKPLSLRLGVAGAVNIAVALAVPEVMGLGYDTLNSAMAQELAISALIIIAAAKIITSSIGMGLGIPGGLIGPTLLTGACIGGAIGLTAASFIPHLGLQPGFYVLLGMAGMMAAVINAPLAALVAVLELTYNPNVIFPAMLTIVVACIGTRQIFGYEGLFHEQLKSTNRLIRVKPAQQSLQRAGVRSLMNKDFVVAPRSLDYDSAKRLLAGAPQWLIVEDMKRPTAMRAAQLAAWLENPPEEVLTLEEDFDLFSIPADRMKLTPVHESASLWEAYQILNMADQEALFVERTNAPALSKIQGIITLEKLEDFYHA